MSLALREIAVSQTGPFGAAVEHRVSSLGGHVEDRSTRIRHLEELVENPDGEDFGGLDADPEEPGSLFNYLRV